MAAAPRRSARAAAPAPAPASLLPANATHVAAFERHLATRPATTRTAYVADVGALARAAGEVDLLALTARDLRRHLATLHGGGLGGRSLARMLSSWRAFYRFAIERDAGLVENPCAGLRPPRSAKRLPSALSPDEAVRLVTIEGDELLAVRDRALLELAYSSGLRLAELAGLDLDRLDLSPRRGSRAGQGSEGADRSRRRPRARRPRVVARPRAPRLPVSMPAPCSSAGRAGASPGGRSSGASPSGR